MNSKTDYNKFARSESPYASNNNEDIATFNTATSKYDVTHGSSPTKLSKFVTFRESKWFKEYLSKYASGVTLIVTVAAGTNSYGAGNKYYFGGVVSPSIPFTAGNTYTFDQSDASNATHPIQFSITGNGSHAGGSEYTTGITKVGTAGNAGATVTVVVTASTPTLHYYCPNHSGMGNQA